MLDILFGQTVRRCDGVSRRDFLRIGAIGGIGLLRMCSRMQAKAGPGKHKARAKSVILVYLGGGISHHDSFDPKPDAPAEVRGSTSKLSIATNVPGLSITEECCRTCRR